MTRQNVGHIAVGQARGAARRRDGRRALADPRDCDSVLRFVRDYMTESGGRPPSTREIANGAGLPLGRVPGALRLLEQRRLIVTGRFGEARGIRIVGARYLLPETAGITIGAAGDGETAAPGVFGRAAEAR